jgi:hypothetical protein
LSDVNTAEHKENGSKRGYFFLLPVTRAIITATTIETIVPMENPNTPCITTYASLLPSGKSGGQVLINQIVPSKYEKTEATRQSIIRPVRKSQFPIHKNGKTVNRPCAIAYPSCMPPVPYLLLIPATTISGTINAAPEKRTSKRNVLKPSSFVKISQNKIHNSTWTRRPTINSNAGSHYILFFQTQKAPP